MAARFTFEIRGGHHRDTERTSEMQGEDGVPRTRHFLALVDRETKGLGISRELDDEDHETRMAWFPCRHKQLVF